MKCLCKFKYVQCSLDTRYLKDHVFMSYHTSIDHYKSVLAVSMARMSKLPPLFVWRAIIDSRGLGKQWQAIWKKKWILIFLNGCCISYLIFLVTWEVCSYLDKTFAELFYVHHVEDKIYRWVYSNHKMSNINEVFYMHIGLAESRISISGWREKCTRQLINVSNNSETLAEYEHQNHSPKYTCLLTCLSYNEMAIIIVLFTWY